MRHGALPLAIQGALRTILAALIFGLAGPALLTQPATPQPAAEVGTVIDLVPRVEEDLAGTVRELARQNRVHDGGTVRTGRNATATLLFDGVGPVELGSEGELVIDLEELAGKPRFRLSAGWLLVSISRLFRGELGVETDAAKLGIKGTQVAVRAKRQGSTLVMVAEGIASVEAAGVRVEVPAGYVTVVELGEPPLPPWPAAAATRAVFRDGPESLEQEDPILLDGLDLEVDLPRSGPG